jgi:hypothetical protein
MCTKEDLYETKPNHLWSTALLLVQHLQQQYCHCWKHFSKSSFGMGVRPAVVLWWISSGGKIVTFETNSESLEGPEVAHSEIWRIWWLWDGLNLGLHKKLLHCEGRVTRYTVIVQIQLFLHCFFFQECIQQIQMGWSFYLLPVTSSHTHLMSLLCEFWPNLYCSLTLLASHCTPHSLVILDFLNWAYHSYKVEFKSFISIIWSNTGVSSSL